MPEINLGFEFFIKIPISYKAQTRPIWADNMLFFGKEGKNTVYKMVFSKENFILFSLLSRLFLAQMTVELSWSRNTSENLAE